MSKLFLISVLLIVSANAINYKKSLHRILSAQDDSPHKRVLSRTQDSHLITKNVLFAQKLNLESEENLSSVHQDLSDKMNRFLYQPSVAAVDIIVHRDEEMPQADEGETYYMEEPSTNVVDGLFLDATGLPTPTVETDSLFLDATGLPIPTVETDSLFDEGMQQADEGETYYMEEPSTNVVDGLFYEDIPESNTEDFFMEAPAEKGPTLDGVLIEDIPESNTEDFFMEEPAEKGPTLDGVLIEDIPESNEEDFFMEAPAEKGPTLDGVLIEDIPESNTEDFFMAEPAAPTIVDGL